MNGPGTSSLVYLLPYIEQGPIFNQIPQRYFDPTFASGLWGYDGSGNSDAGAGITFNFPAYVGFWGPPAGSATPNFTRIGPAIGVDASGNPLNPPSCNSIKTYVCPLDPKISAAGADTVVDGGMFVTGHNEGNGVYIEIMPGDETNLATAPTYISAQRLGTTNYAGVGGYLGGDDPRGNPTNNPPGTADGLANTQPFDYRGIYYNNSHTRITDVKDGTAFTLAFGELASGQDTKPGGSWGNFVYAWFGVGFFCTGFNIDTPPHTSPWSCYSYHPGGILFANADGSVRNITKSANPHMFHVASGKNDGLVRDDSLLTQ
jgi:hypothetical protein